MAVKYRFRITGMYHNKLLGDFIGETEEIMTWEEVNKLIGKPDIIEVKKIRKVI